MNIKYPPFNTITGVPRAHQTNSLENFENYYTKEFYEDLEKIALQVVEGKFKHNYLILCGSPGSGKSHFLVGLYKALVGKLGYIHGEGALFITFSDLMSEMIVRFGKEVHSMRELLVEYWGSSWLFLDDITSTERVFKADSMENTVFRDTLIERWDKQKYVAFTSNFLREDLIKFITTSYGSYVASRVISSATIIEFPKKDFRFQRNKPKT
jgi:DNA replication protein DnaC